MDFYWQVTVGELLLTIAVFAVAVTAYGPLASWTVRRSPATRGIAAGALFGAATSAALVLPVHLDVADAAIGTQAAMISLAAPLGGPLAALVATVAAGAVAVLQTDGPVATALPTLLVIAIAALGGVRFRWRGRRLTDHRLPLIGLPGAVAGAVLPALLHGGWAALRSGGTVPPLATGLSALAATMLLGTLLIREHRRLHAESDLRASEQRYRLLADHATDLIVRIGPDQSLDYVSPAVRDVIGGRPEGYLGRSPLSLVHPDDAPAVAAALAGLGVGGHTTVTHRAPPVAGRPEAWLETSLTNMVAAGQPAGIVGVVRDVTARHAAEEAVRQANAQLAAQAADIAAARDAAEASSRAKSEFLAAMSHELRTPLNAVIGFSEIISSQMLGPVGNPVYVEYAGDIRYSGTHLLELITDILDFSKAEARELMLGDGDVDLGQTISVSCRMLETRAQRAQVALDTDVEPDLPRLRGDDRRVRQILINLLSNAIKFTPAGGRVHVAAGLAPEGGLIVTVADTGIGIAPEHLSLVLEPFRQIEGHLGGAQEGTGLGLPLTKRLVELHGGSLTMVSTPGRGTAVTVAFPADRTQPPAPGSPASGGAAAETLSARP